MGSDLFTKALSGGKVQPYIGGSPFGANSPPKNQYSHDSNSNAPAVELGAFVFQGAAPKTCSVFPIIWNSPVHQSQSGVIMDVDDEAAQQQGRRSFSVRSTDTGNEYEIVARSADAGGPEAGPLVV
ncbi:hypothetical protein KM043_005142 [Ampulex compressa]|nr:hypothetical protein KM043_005142 [Ampulex compressa]